jgi:PIN domain nuclease of toxin-antitoxin system
VILLDTHVLLWMDLGKDGLGPATQRLIQTGWTEGRICVSAISFWECAMLHRRGRVNLRLAPVRWRAELLAAGLIEHRLDGETGIVAAQLEARHRDPADRFIAATAVVNDATLVTADDQLLRLRSKLKLQNARR